MPKRRPLVDRAQELLADRAARAPSASEAVSSTPASASHEPVAPRRGALLGQVLGAARERVRVRADSEAAREDAVARYL